jgi:uncharacterized protein
VVVFIDTSSLAKRYIEEYGSSEIDTFYSNSYKIAISSTTSIEMISVFNRKLKDQSISSETFTLAYENFRCELPNYHSLPFNENTVNTAIDCLNRYHIKTLDALQLASAIICTPGLFVSSDKKLFDFACNALNCECRFI